MKLSYNAQGQRVRKQIGSNPAIYYAYDLQGQLLGEYTLSGTQYKPLIEYIWLEGQPVAVVRPTPGAPASAGNIAQEVFYIHTDHLGAPRLATDQAGTTRWRWFGGEPFGVSPAETNPNGLGELNITLRLPGQQYDGFVGLHYNYFRDYDPTTGRYVQSDLIGLAGVSTPTAMSREVRSIELTQRACKLSCQGLEASRYRYHFQCLDSQGHDRLTRQNLADQRTCLGAMGIWVARCHGRLLWNRGQTVSHGCPSSIQGGIAMGTATLVHQESLGRS